jgi:hypothetical protein
MIYINLKSNKNTVSTKLCNWGMFSLKMEESISTAKSYDKAKAIGCYAWLPVLTYQYLLEPLSASTQPRAPPPSHVLDSKVL